MMYTNSNHRPNRQCGSQTSLIFLRPPVLLKPPFTYRSHYRCKNSFQRAGDQKHRREGPIAHMDGACRCKQPHALARIDLL